MSFDASPRLADRATEIHGAEIHGADVLADVLDGGRDLTGMARNAPSPEADGVLLVRLPHMNVVIAVSGDAPLATGPAFEPKGRSADGGEGTIHFRVAGGVGAAGLPAQLWRGKASHDPVVQRLSHALAAADASTDPRAGLYADALRLAVVTRILGVAARAPLPDAPIKEAEPTPSTRRSKSGLVAWRLKRVLAFIDERLAQSVTLVDMAAVAGLSRMHFAAQFRVATGLRPHEYLLKRRIERAQQMLRETREPLVQVALGVGFQTQAHFTTVFRRFVGETPYQWRCANAVRN